MYPFEGGPCRSFKAGSMSFHKPNSQTDNKNPVYHAPENLVQVLVVGEGERVEVRRRGEEVSGLRRELEVRRSERSCGEAV